MTSIRKTVLIRSLNVALRLSSLFSKLIIVLILSRELSAYDFGYYGLFASVLVYCVGFIGFEFHTYSNRALLTSSKGSNQIITNHVVFSVGAILLSAPAIFAVFYFKLLPSSLVVYFIGILLFEYLALELSRIFNVLDGQIVSSILLFIRTTLWMIPASYLFINNAQNQTLHYILQWWFWGAFLSFVIGLLYVLIFYKYKFSFLYVDLSWIVKGIKKAAGMFVSAQAVLLLFVIDRYFIKFEVGIELVSVYVFYFGLTNAILALFESSFFVFYTPKILKLFHKNNIFEINYECIKLLRIILICCLFIGFSSYYLVDYIIEFVGKQIYVEYKNIFFLLLLSALIRILSLAYHFAIYAIKEDRYLIKINLLSVMLFPVFFYMFNINFHALYAASISMLCINVMHLVLKYVSWHLLLKIKSK